MVRSSPLVVALCLIAADLLMESIAVTRYPRLFSQPGAATFVAEPALALLIYAAVALWLTWTHRLSSVRLRRLILGAGLVTGALEVLAIVGESAGVPVHGPVVPIGFMLLSFSGWGLAGFAAARLRSGFIAGTLVALCAAGFCMLIAVTAGFSLELFLHPPLASSVATWAEFQRSGWSDAHAFGLANTLDSGFTHLAAAPVVGALAGALGSGFARLLHGCAAPIQSPR
jgi:hypothetical protein